MPNTSLQTKVRNVSNKDLSFPFLGAHGVRLAAGDEYVQDGDLIASLSGRRMRRRLHGLLSALSLGLLALVHTPAQHYYDETLDVTSILTIDNGVVIVTSPSWGSYSSSI